MIKKGSGHLEMILAFTIFLVLVVFILVYIKPLDNTKLSDVAIISLKDSFTELANTQLVTVFVNGSSASRNAPANISSKNWIYKNFTDNFYYVHFSDEFQSNEPTETLIIGSISNSTVLSNKSLTNIEKKYYFNYTGLKEDLGIPAVLNFEIYTLDGQYSMRKEVSGEIEVIAKSYLLSVLNANGELINREFVFSIW
jgi:hypothetical protein